MVPPDTQATADNVRFSGLVLDRANRDAVFKDFTVLIYCNGLIQVWMTWSEPTSNVIYQIYMYFVL